MAQPKTTYSFSSTKEDCNLERIVNENPESTVIVLSRKARPTITIVTQYRNRLNLSRAGHDALAWSPTHDFAVYAGDVHAIALGLVETKVEAY